MTCLIELARVAKADGRSVDALDHLREVYEPVHRGPYPMEEADARALAAEIAFESGDRSTAVAEAGRAFAMAWCDGPPYAYASGLHSAASVLSRCGAQPPLLPAFDRARFAGLPEVSVSASGDIEVNADRWGGRTSMLGRFLVIARFRATRTPTPLSPRGKQTS
jgi:hypothetical protein